MHENKRGQGLVELALVLPLLLLVFFMIIDTAFLIQGYLATNHAAREAARFAVTAQPAQTRCYDYNRNGNLADEVYPWCPYGGDEATESNNEYYNRRVIMIKQIAVNSAVGLRIEDLGLTPGDISQFQNNEGFFGVRVWGFPDYDTPEQEDHPGLGGLPVRVQVIHNVPLVTFGVLLPEQQVKVSGVTEMINEGIQVGIGDKAPPTSGAIIPISTPGGGIGGGTGPGEIEATNLQLNFETAENLLPVDISHEVIAIVTGDDASRVGNAPVVFKITNTSDADYTGSFHPTDTNITQVTANTFSNGEASVIIYSDVPGRAEIQAWVDSDGDNKRDSGEPQDTAVKTWAGGQYNLRLNFEVAENILPDDREHMVEAHVTTLGGGNVGGAPVVFHTNAGSFSYSGVGADTDIANSGADGKARTVIYSNKPATATIEAWIDYDKDMVMDAGEPSDVATKIWKAPGPYIVLTDHNPEPLMVVSSDVMNHLATDNPYSLWWCPNPGALTTTVVISQVAYPINVDAGTLDYLGIPLEVPVNAFGEYRLESHTGNGGANGCADSSTLVAYSAPLRIKEVPPDLVITNITMINKIDELMTGLPITLVIDVLNDAPSVMTGGPFDLDIYMNIDDAPTQFQFGLTKQWIDNLAPFESTVITVEVINYSFGPNQIWAQVDTTNYIDEGDSGGEDNNVYGPIDVELDCGEPDPNRSDSFDGGIKPIWSVESVGSNSDGSHSVVGDQLVIDSRGTTIYSGNNSFYYLYQTYNDDFDARVRFIQKPHPVNRNWAKTGLMVRESVAPNAPYVFNAMTNDRTPAGSQSLYRASPGGGGSRITGDKTINLPIWSRIVRKDNTYDYYFSNAAEPTLADWTHYGTYNANRELGTIGIANASYDSGRYAESIVDDFRICTVDAGSGAGPDINPPGLIQCQELIKVPSFEGNNATVADYWKGGLSGSYRRDSTYLHTGSFAMRLNAAIGGDGSSCDVSDSLDPYVYQEVKIPTSVFSISTLVVDGYYIADFSNLPCSEQPSNRSDTGDTSDTLNLELNQIDGSGVVSQTIINGLKNAPLWQRHALTISASMDLTAFAGQKMRLQWHGAHDGDTYGTSFYMEDISAQLCTSWPIPPEQAGTASIGGIITTLGELAIPQPLPGADVWAYAQAGELYHTQAIHDGNYHFYNIPAGDYIVYSEAWVSGQPRYASVSVTATTDQRDYTINLFLQ